MKFVQSIIAVVILLFGTGGIDGNTIDTPALNPYTHYINITILYHSNFISSLYRPSEEVLPEYGVVLASCFLNISNQVADPTTDITSDIVSVSVQNVNISLFLHSSYRVTLITDENDEGDTMVIFEFYISQDDTLIPATTAIEVFNRNCNVSGWRDGFTSNAIAAVAVFSSMQLMQSISSQIVSTTFSQNTQISTFPTSSIQSLEPTIGVSSTVTSSQRMTTSVSTSQSPETSSIESSSTAIPLATTIPSSMLQLSTSIPSPSASSSQYTSQTESTITEFTSSSSLITSARITPSTTVIPTETIPITQSTSVLTDSITNFGNIVINYFSSSSIPPTRILQSLSIFVSPMDASFVSATITQSSRLPTNNITISRNFTGSNITGSSSSSLPIQPILPQSSIVRTMDSRSFVSTSIPQSSRIPTYTMSSSRNLLTSNITRISSNSLPTDSIRTILSQSMSTRATNLTTILSNSTQFVTRSSQSLDRITRTNSTQFLFTNSTAILSQQTSTSISTSQPSNTTRLLFSSSYTPLPVSSVPTTQSQSNTFRTTDSRNIISSLLYPVNATQFITPVSVTTTRSLVSDLAQTNSTQLLLNSTTIPRNISIPTSSSTVLPVISSTQDVSQVAIPSFSVAQEPSALFSTFNISSIQSTTTRVFQSTTTPPIIHTPALNPYTHYINITILYHSNFISNLYRSSEEVLPEYGVVLASCFLNISNQVSDSTTDITSDIASVSVQNVNISLFLDSYRVTLITDENDEGDTMVIFEFYISQDDTLIPATTAIEVFNRNCNVNDWRDDFTSNAIVAIAVFSSMQSLIIPTSSSTVLPVISSTQIPSLNVSSRSIPQQPSSTLFNISSMAIIPSTTQSFLSTTQPITSTTTIPSPIQPTLHYLEAIFTFETLSDDVTYQIPYILQAIANRYLNTTVSLLPSESALLLSITIGDVTFNALIDQLNQSHPLDSIVTARILFYVTNNTTPLLSTDLKTQLDVYSIDQWSNSTGLEVISVESNLYGLVSSSSIPTTSQITPTLSIMSTLVRPTLIRSSIIPQSMPAATPQSMPAATTHSTPAATTHSTPAATFSITTI